MDGNSKQWVFCLAANKQILLQMTEYRYIYIYIYSIYKIDLSGLYSNKKTLYNVHQIMREHAPGLDQDKRRVSVQLDNQCLD